MRLRAQLILLLLVIAILPVAILLFYNRLVFENDLLSIRSHDLLAEASLTASHLDSMLAERQRLAILLAEQAASANAAVSVLESAVRSNEYFRSASIVDASGTVLASTPRPSLPASILKPDAFRTPAISDPTAGANGPSIYFSAPLRGGKRAVFLEVDANEFFSLGRQTGKGPGSSEATIICDDAGICLAHTRRGDLQLRSLHALSDDRIKTLIAVGRLDQDRPVGALENDFVRRLMNVRTNPAFRFRSSDGGENLGGAVELKTKPWVIAQTIPISTAMEPSSNLERTILLASLLMLVPTLMIGYDRTRAILHPLEMMTRTVSNIGFGRWKPIEVHRSDEIGTLARAFNEMQENLDRSHKQAIQIEKLATIGTLTSSVAHEIMNPLTVILGRLQMLANSNEPLPPKVLDNLTSIERQSQRIKKIADNLLGFARVKRQPNRGEVELLGVLKEAQALLEIEMHSKHVPLIGPAASDPIVVSGDRDQLLQVFINLMKNAIDALTSEGTLRVEFRSNANGVEVLFQDTGTGIPEENLSRIFDPLFTTKPPGKGTGLGLPVVKGIVISHGGSIRIESRVGFGTTVIVSLPKAPRMARPLETAFPTTPVTEGASASI